jgi:hypothetical protein
LHGDFRANREMKAEAVHQLKEVERTRKSLLQHKREEEKEEELLI